MHGAQDRSRPPAKLQCGSRLSSIGCLLWVEMSAFMWFLISPRTVWNSITAEARRERRDNVGEGMCSSASVWHGCENVLVLWYVNNPYVFDLIEPGTVLHLAYLCPAAKKLRIERQAMKEAPSTQDL